MGEGRTAMSVKNGSNGSPEDEWLGAEAHMPNFNRELRRREPRRTGVPSLWMLGALFAAGLAAGGLAMRLFDRRSRPS
ncbi:MAG: hypothetical protein ABL935_02500 [Nitrospiraceae bacterium]